MYKTRLRCFQPVNTLMKSVKLIEQQQVTRDRVDPINRDLVQGDRPPIYYLNLSIYE